jgi:hypothetical protein
MRVPLPLNARADQHPDFVDDSGAFERPRDRPSIDGPSG